MASAARGPAGDESPAPRVAIVGGGVSGLFCATTLSQYGYTVSLFDMGKSAPGGRMTTRRTQWKGLQFDHGCQFIRAESPDFKAVVDGWVDAGVAAPWAGRIGVLDVGLGRFIPREEAAAALGDSGGGGDGAGGGSSGGGGGGSRGGGEASSSGRGAADDAAGFAGLLRPGQLYVGAPGMDAICAHMAAHGGISAVRSDVQVQKALLDPDGKWLLEGRIRQPLRTAQERKQEAPFTPWNLGAFDALVLADRMAGSPASPGYVSIEGSSAAAKMQATMAEAGAEPCLALMLGFEGGRGPALPFEAAAVRGSRRITWVCLDSAKPARAAPGGAQCLVALATPSFSRHLAPRGPDGRLPPQTPELLAALAPALLDALREALGAAGVDLPPPAFMQAHRWGAAFPARPAAGACLRADKARLAACGDFCAAAGGGGGSVEAAVLSGRAAADAVRRWFE